MFEKCSKNKFLFKFFVRFFFDFCSNFFEFFSNFFEIYSNLFRIFGHFTRDSTHMHCAGPCGLLRKK
jgi:hypothetical protein